MVIKLISIYQYNINPVEPEKNLEKVNHAAQLAHVAGSSLLVLPELCLHGYNYKEIPSMAKWSLPDALDSISLIAKENSLSIVGTFVEKEKQGYFNSFVWIDPDGTIRHKYRKSHLFNLLGEGDFFTAGNRISTFETPLGSTGSAICYDLRFPELFRKLALEGCKIVMIPAEWPDERIDHWRILLQARAIENQIFVVGVNCIGRIFKVDYGGHSMVISPWGEVLGELGTEEGVLTVKVDMEETEFVRRRLPVIKDRRPDIY